MTGKHAIMGFAKTCVSRWGVSDAYTDNVDSKKPVVDATCQTLDASNRTGLVWDLGARICA